MNPRSSAHSGPLAKRLRRLHALSRLLDSAIPLPGGYRVGIDGFLGLVPGLGDVAGGLASSYIIIESARLGATTGTLLRMVFNVLLEALIGLIPLVGDLFDFVWKANEKNMALMERQLSTAPPHTTAEFRLKATVAIILLLLVVGIVAIAYLGFHLLLAMVAALRGAVA